MSDSYIKGVISKAIEFSKSGKIIDCICHVFDMLNIYINYGNDKELRIQKKLLNKTLKYAYTNCEYYKEIAKSLADKDDIRSYSIINKKTILDNFDDISSNNKDKMIYNIASTGGSSGQPLRFLNANGIDDYYQYQLWKRFGHKKGDVILNMTGEKIDLEDLNKGIYWKTRVNQDTSYGKYLLSSLYLNGETIGTYVDYILDLKPDFIRGYPSFIYEIADYIKKNNININFKIKGIELTSETSDKWQWDIIADVFKTKIILQYGHTEGCVFAFSYDESMKLKVEPMYGYVEILDEKGNRVKKGEIGEVVCTSLHNNVMPFIRYNTGDLAEYGGFDGKYLILNKIIGRTSNYIINSNGEKINLNPFISEHQAEAIKKIVKYQFEQNKKGEVIIRIVKTDDYSDEDEKELKELFKSGKFDCKFEYVDDIKKTIRGKQQLLIQNIKNNH